MHFDVINELVRFISTHGSAVLFQGKSAPPVKISEVRQYHFTCCYCGVYQHTRRDDMIDNTVRDGSQESPSSPAHKMLDLVVYLSSKAGDREGKEKEEASPLKTKLRTLCPAAGKPRTLCLAAGKPRALSPAAGKLSAFCPAADKL
jgi:hypothetical protein